MKGRFYPKKSMERTPKHKDKAKVVLRKYIRWSYLHHLLIVWSVHREFATFFNFAKASIGSGSFALPWGILQIGVILGSYGMVFLGILR